MTSSSSGQKKSAALCWSMALLSVVAMPLSPVESFGLHSPISSSRHHTTTPTKNDIIVPSKSSRLSVSLASDVEIDNMPPLNQHGIYTCENEAQHKALLEAHKDKLVIMKVFAPWCRACKGLDPKFKLIAKDKKYENLPMVWAELSIQHNKEYVKSIGVLALPTIQFYAHGQIMDTFPCGPSKVPILRKKLASLVNDNVDPNTLQLKAPADETGVTGIPTGEQAAQQPTEADKKDEETVASLMRKGLKTKLRTIPYFSVMLESDFDTLLSKARILNFETGSIIMREGNMGRTFYVIVEGEVEICQKTSFEDPLTTPPSYLGTVINRFTTDEYFGERALITGEPRAASIRASSRTKCIVFDRDDFPASCILSGKVGAAVNDQEKDLENINEKYGVTLGSISTMNKKQFDDTVAASQTRGSANTPKPIAGVDTDDDIDFDMEDAVEAEVVAPVTQFGAEAEVIVPLLMRFKLIRLVARCFDYIVQNRLRIGEEGSRNRRNMLVKLLSPSQQVEFTDAFNLLDADGDGEITLIELRRLMESIGEDRSDEELIDVIESSHQAMDGRQVMSYEDFVGIMAEAEFYNLFIETFSALDKRDSGYVRAKDLDRVLCGVRDLITDDRRSVIDVEDTEMMVDYEQFSRMLLGGALK